MADVGDVVRTVMRYSSPGASEQLNVFYHEVRDNGIGNPALLNRMAEWATDDWGPLWQSLAANSSTIVDVSCDLMNLDGSVKVNIGIDPVGLAGSGPPGVSAAAVAGYLLAQTALPKSRGSKYVPGIDQVAIDEGLFTPAALIDLILLAAVYISPISTVPGATLFAGILSRPLIDFVEFLTEVSSTDVPAYQRRRKPTVGS